MADAPVEVGAGAALGGHAAGEHELLGVPPGGGRASDVAEPVGQVEDALDVGLGGPRPHDAAARPAAEQQVERVGEHGLAGARLPREHVQPGAEPQLGPLDQQQVLDTQFAEHVPRCTSAPRRMGRAVAPVREPTGTPCGAQAPPCGAQADGAGWGNVPETSAAIGWERGGRANPPHVAPRRTRVTSCSLHMHDPPHDRRPESNVRLCSLHMHDPPQGSQPGTHVTLCRPRTATGRSSTHQGAARPPHPAPTPRQPRHGPSPNPFLS